MKRLHLLLSAAFVCCALVCSACKLQDACLDARYKHALEDVLLAEPSEVDPHLTAITATNPDTTWKDGRVLVVTWTKHGDSYPACETITTTWGDTWVTVVPQVQQFVARHHVPGVRLVLRLEQLLGLPQDSGYTWFAELWVKPDDLFRPCPDPEIDDTACQTELPDNATPEYTAWYNDNILSSYFSEKKYPWTRLGYTYDWGSLVGEIGLSEFVIKKNADVIVEQTVATEDYFR